MKRLLFTIFLHPSVFFSAAAAFFCWAVHVSTTNLGGIVGTIVLKPDTDPEALRSAITLLRVAGVGWLLTFVFLFRRALKKEEGN